ncbi:hypothetical protein Hbl1158_10145 [Halobaculum sp. CBA1158]|uniref:hypothetical protein n=1 Tax=Halobaculum sp. CBA1158 TaxID=2904243 RepID=UPI001F3220A4|nr:hypothetical protein [Halobaculum sp. CBA1158]UIO98894.1 hypothetical protein Hbl1158_10145 [Halobaculum sp. CBA1158]
MLAQYCHVVDVLRKFNPQLTESAIESDDYIGYSDLAQIQARIDAVSSDFDDKTGRALRELRVGSPGMPATYEYQDARNAGRGSRPIRVSLDHDNIIPLDPSTGDVFEVRTGKDSWRDITPYAGSKYSLNHRDGAVKIWQWLRQLIWWGAPDDRYLRTSYRYGALGGDRSEGGQTTLASSATDSTTTLSVETAGRLPSTGLLLVANDEYVRIESVDHDADELTVERGVRATTPAAHDAGDAVHYCPETVRDAIAGKVAEELLRYDDWVDELPEASSNLGGVKKTEAWEDEYDQALAKHSGVRKL